MRLANTTFLVHTLLVGCAMDADLAPEDTPEPAETGTPPEETGTPPEENGEPPLTSTTLFVANWEDNSVYRVPDISSVADGTTATPEILAGSETGFTGFQGYDLLAYDDTRDLLYVCNSGAGRILVFENGEAVTGNQAPDRSIALLNGTDRMSGIELDGRNDRLYVRGTPADGDADEVFVIEAASTTNGLIVPTRSIVLPEVDASGCLSLDPVHDRLYVSSLGIGIDARLYVVDQVSSRADGVTPNRSVRFSSGRIYCSVIDGERDRLYVTSRLDSAGDNNVFIFDDPGSLDGIVDPDAASAARLSFGTAMVAALDGLDNLYVLRDSAEAVSVFPNASTLSGDILDAPREIEGAVNKSYSLYPYSR